MHNHLYLAHHGIKGQRWGVRNGPPYPLGESDKSSAEKRAENVRGRTRIKYSRASVNAYGSGHIKDSHRAVIAQINGIADEKKKSRLLKKEERAYKKALKNQEASDKLRDVHEKKLTDIESKYKNKIIKALLTHNENTSYNEALKKQEQINDGRAALKKALVIAGVVAVTAAVGYSMYKGYSAPEENIASDVFLKLDRAAGTNRYSEALKHNYSNPITGNIYHMKNNYSKSLWNDTLTSGERHAIKAYTGSSYDAMNFLLRTGTPKYGKIDGPQHRKTAALIKECTEGLSKSRTAEDCIVHRGIGSSLSKCIGVSSMDLLTDPDKIIGHSFVDKGFVSTGVSSADAWGGVKMHAFIPKGSQGMYVDPISQYQGEHELLLQRGSEFVIRSYKKDNAGNITDIFVDLVDQLVDD